MKKVSSVDEYIMDHPQWENALIMLREIITSTELEETIKWSTPTYTINKKNVLGMAAFKSYVGIWFFNGVFLKDTKKKLVSADDTTKAMRQWRFESTEEIENELENILEYLSEAIENQKAGKELKPEKNKPLIIPNELEEVLAKDKHLRLNFESLSLTKKREYVGYIGNAKREETRRNRLMKAIPVLLDGKGLMDKYR